MTWSRTLLSTLGALLALAAPASAASASGNPLAGLPPRSYVVGTYNGVRLRLYVNGKLVAQRRAHGSVDASTAPLEIGAYAGQAVWAGQIDEVAIYNRALDTSALAAHYKLGLIAHPGQPNAYRHAVLGSGGLVSYWHLDDPGLVAGDSHGANNGHYRSGVTRGSAGLISGDPDKGVVFKAPSGSIVVPPSPSLQLARAFTLEAWVTTSAVGNHAILGRVGSYFLVTNVLGHWEVGAAIAGRTQSASSTFAARAPVLRKAHRRPRQPSPGGGFNPVWLLVLAVPVAAGIILRRRWRAAAGRDRYADDPADPDTKGAPPAPVTRDADPRRPASRPKPPPAPAPAPPAPTPAAKPSARDRSVDPHLGRLPLMNSMRAIAALLVLISHAAVYSGEDVGSGSGPYFQHLDVGVAIFFLISGLLLYRPFALAHLEGRPAQATGAYAWRRVLRIVPAYWLALTIIILALGSPRFGPPVFTLTGVPRYYLFAQDYWAGSIGGGLGQAWTLSIEVAFYIFLPFYAWLQRRGGNGLVRALRAEIAGLVVLVVISEVWKIVALGNGRSDNVLVGPWLTSLPAFLDQFALGMGLGVLSAWITVRRRNPSWVSAFDRAPWLSWVVALLAFWLVSRQVLPLQRFAHWTPAQYLGRQWLYAVVALALLLPAVIGDQRRGAIRRILRFRALAWVGLVSYGIYLWHVAVLESLKRLGFTAQKDVFAYIAWPVACLIITAAIAAASYYGVERPALSLKRMVGGRGSGEPRSGAAASSSSQRSSPPRPATATGPSAPVSTTTTGRRP